MISIAPSLSKHGQKRSDELSSKETEIHKIRKP